MCKIIVVINKNPKLNSVIKKIVKANVEELAEEKDGYSVFRNSTDTHYIGTNAYDNIEKNLEYKGEYMYIVHTRTTTAGSAGLSGLHLQKMKGGYTYAHNGTVTKYSNVKLNSDSYYFFRHLIAKNKTITADVVSEEIKNTSFRGKGVLYNYLTNDLYFFNNMIGYVNVLNGCIILSSYDLEKKLNVEKTHSINGYTWKTKGKETAIKGILHSESIDDMYIHFKNGLLVEKKSIPNTSNFSSYSYTMYGNRKWDIEKQQWSLDEEEKHDIVANAKMDLTEEEKKNILADEELYIKEMISNGFTVNELQNEYSAIGSFEYPQLLSQLSIFK